MFAVLNASGVVCALKETDDPIADVFTVVAVDSKFPPAVGDVGIRGQNGKWTFSSPHLTDVSVVKAARVEVLRLACEATITGGFKSNALGNTHFYPSDIKAQINLMGSVTDSIMPNLPTNWTTPFWVCDEAGVWAWKMHNAGQIQQAGRDGKAHVVRCQTLLGELTVSVLAATTAEAVTTIVWPEGGNT
ncbi:MAG TPA: hypothetical protein DCW88_20210 [Agrobacterium sp.]|uniref:DUF4376 domain-containing protein n=1 Tax=Agrobacterium pusense TaxID=648995 RepID=UPI000E8FDC6E|nr:hypothetical protein [Agrobacterium sp.]